MLDDGIQLGSAHLAADITRQELTLVEHEIAGLRRTAWELREQLGDLHGTDDPAASATLFTMIAEQDAFLSALSARREDLQHRLRQNDAAVG